MRKWHSVVCRGWYQWPLIYIFYTQLVKIRAILCPRQLATRGDNTDSVTMAVLPTLVPPAVFATRLGIVLTYQSFAIFFYNCKSYFQRCVKSVCFWSLTNTQRSLSERYHFQYIMDSPIVFDIWGSSGSVPRNR